MVNRVTDTHMGSTFLFFCAGRRVDWERSGAWWAELEARAKGWASRPHDPAARPFAVPLLLVPPDPPCPPCRVDRGPPPAPPARTAPAPLPCAGRRQSRRDRFPRPRCAREDRPWLSPCRPGRGRCL